MRHRLGVAVSAAVAVLAAGPPATAGAVGNGKIVFTSQAGHVLTVNPDGSGLKDITPLANTTFCVPSWSPRGDRIAVIEQPNPNYLGWGNLWVMNADGRLPRVIPTAHPEAFACDRPAWSPDGKTIAYTGALGMTPYGSFSQIDVVPSNGLGTARQLTDGTRYSDTPTWSPDGKRIAFLSEEPNVQFRFHVIPAAGGPDTALPLAPYDARRPDWSPDGTKLVAERYVDADRAYELWTLSTVDGAPLQRLTAGGVPDNPAWSPDGSKVVFWRPTSATARSGDIKYVPADGSTTETQVVAAPFDFYVISPDWQPVP